MRLPAPVFGAVQTAKYREIHSQLPVLMRIYMYCAQTSAALLVVIGLSVISPPVAIGVWYTLPVVQAFFPALNIFVPFGFRLFSWLVRQ